MAKWQLKYRVDWDATDGRNGGAQQTVWEMLMEMERFNGKAKAEEQGAVVLVSDLAKAFERVSLPVVWAWATHFNIPRKILRVLGGYFEHQRRVQFEDGHLVRVQVELLTSTVLQDALSEVTKMHPPLKLRVSVDGITALLKGRNKEMVEMADKVLRKLKKEVEENGLKLSVTENGKEGKSKMVTSRRYVEENLWECSFQKRVVMAESVEKLGVDLRTQTKQLGAKEKAREKSDLPENTFWGSE